MRLIESLPSQLLDLLYSSGKIFGDRFKITVTIQGIQQCRRVIKFIEAKFSNDTGGRYILTDPNAVLDIGSSVGLSARNPRAVNEPVSPGELISDHYWGTGELVSTPTSRLFRYRGVGVFLYAGVSVFAETRSLTFGTRDRRVVESFFSEFAQWCREQYSAGQLEVYYNEGRYWASLRSRRIRPVASLYLPGDMAEEILTVARNFFEDKDEYERLGVPYRYGLYFWGVPGAGKSTAAQVIAGELGKPLYCLNLNSQGMSSGRLMSLIHGLPDGCILCLDDAKFTTEGFVFPEVRRGDSSGGLNFLARAINHDGDSGDFEEEYEGDSSLLSFEDFLAALDGPLASEGRLLIVTSMQSPEEIPEALRRSGRLDRHFYFGHIGTSEVMKMSARFFPAYTDTGKVRLFASRVHKMEITAAMLQGHFMKYKGDPDSAFSIVPHHE